LWLQSAESDGVTMIGSNLRYKIYKETGQDNACDNRGCQEDPFFTNSSLFATITSITVTMILSQSPKYYFPFYINGSPSSKTNPSSKL
jgi:hypothetical protein